MNIKKKFRILSLIMVMCMVFTMSGSGIAYATPRYNAVEGSQGIFEINNFESIKKTFKEDPSQDVYIISETEDELMYKLGEIEGQIKRLESSSQKEIYEITEGKITNIFEYNKITKDIYVDGEKIEIEVIIEPTVGTMSEWGDPFGIEKINVRLNKAIKSFTSSALALVIGAATGMPTIVSIAAAIISGAGVYADNTTLFCIRHKEMHSSYYKYRKVYTYYYLPNYTVEAAVYYQEIMGGS